MNWNNAGQPGSGNSHVDMEQAGYNTWVRTVDDQPIAPGYSPLAAGNLELPILCDSRLCSYADEGIEHSHFTNQ